MPTPSEIKSKAKKINEANSDLSKGKDRCQGYVYNSTSWWQSEAGKALRSQYSEIQVDVMKMLSKISNLENCTTRLASNVQRADDERRKAEEQKRLALAAKKK